MKSKWMIIMVALLIAVGAQASYVSLATGTGALGTGGTWAGGVVPSGNSTGLLTSASIVNIWTSNPLVDSKIRQTGGYVNGAATADVTFRGAVSAGAKTLYEIEDSNVNYGSYTNISFNNLSFWTPTTSYGTVEFNLLSGSVVVKTNFTINATSAILNVKDGLFTSTKATLSAAGRVNMLAGGDADVTLGQLTTSGLNAVWNFETGNTGTLTINQTSAGADFGLGQWNWMAANNKLMVDGSVVTNLSNFALSNANKTITLIPEPATIGMLGLGAVTAVFLRRLRR